MSNKRSFPGGSIPDEVGHGFAIITDAFSLSTVAEAKAEVAWRIYALANKSRVFDDFALHEDVLALNDYFLDPGYLINSFQSTMHYDHGYVTMERPHRPIGTKSMLFFLSTLWHGGGANTSDGSRLALTVQYCQPWIRPMENQILAVDWEKLDEIPERLADMLGYKELGTPAVGRLLKRYKGIAEAKL
ncbi:hypothetical protein GGI35DRAFT_472742 [Trichoderma velutinum]